MRLLGKPLITAVTTAGSGLRSTENYLDAMLTCLGTVVIGHLRGIAYTPGDFDQRESCKKKHEALAKKAAKILRGERPLRPGLKNEWYFLGMKMKAKYAKDLLSYEHKYWLEKGWFKKTYASAMKSQQYV